MRVTRRNCWRRRTWSYSPSALGEPLGTGGSLLRVRWLRVILDEGHVLGASLSLSCRGAVGVRCCPSRLMLPPTTRWWRTCDAFDSRLQLRQRENLPADWSAPAHEHSLLGAREV